MMNTACETEEPQNCCKQRCQDPWRKLVAPICACLVLAAIVVAIVMAVVHNNGGGSGPSPSPSPPPIFTGPLRGVAYAPLPCTTGSCKDALPNSDVMQIGYKAQWGKDGRNDLDVIKKLGGNALRLYHSFGYGPKTDHGSFLDAAHSKGLNVMPGVDSDLAIHNCTNFDCYEQVKEVIKTGFDLGFAKGGDWHPAVHTVILFNEPDFFANDPKCPKKEAWCRVKAAISALDGLLAAEKEAKIRPGRVNLTTTWSFAALDSIDGKCKKCPGYFGFQDMLAVMKNASIANYTPRTSVQELADAFDKRWVNALNVQAPWSFVKDTITKNYAPFGNRPWFIGEFGDLAQPHETLKNDVKDMHDYANSSSVFLGGTVFQFQTAYWKGGSEMSFGLFGLGKEKIADTGDVCDHTGKCAKWPVYCLTTDLSWLPKDQAQRANAVAAAWNGTVTGLCSNTTRIVV